MKTNGRLLALARKYHELKGVHKFALCQAAEANQNDQFSKTASLLLDTHSHSDIRVLKAYISHRVLPV
jgi:hypothetical protein